MLSSNNFEFRPNTVPFLLGSKAVPSGRLCQHTSVLTRENNDLEENMINGNVERLFLHSQEYFFKCLKKQPKAIFDYPRHYIHQFCIITIVLVFHLTHIFNPFYYYTTFLTPLYYYTNFFNPFCYYTSFLTPLHYYSNFFNPFCYYTSFLTPLYYYTNFFNPFCYYTSILTPPPPASMSLLPRVGLNRYPLNYHINAITTTPTTEMLIKSRRDEVDSAYFHIVMEFMIVKVGLNQPP
ncbi:hypothetical protein DAPPUDRAFT_274842 [Daphnia pulex]|uniref:Uncharacterized protein n=1 Tax=Daphnia pulex TaxID=6669 RepID=E9I4T4_DAPPU|nr:hypothetical protein DAPPUDRAFT_274842 [Daphnia pulex]|eukprot:EFX60996.1 hypothetical protein DAPPUDRAFT_274842 [Daphnia pulex]